MVAEIAISMDSAKMQNCVNNLFIKQIMDESGHRAAISTLLKYFISQRAGGESVNTTPNPGFKFCSLRAEIPVFDFSEREKTPGTPLVAKATLGATADQCWHSLLHFDSVCGTKAHTQATARTGEFYYFP
jgi:hypothetical protein